MGDFSVLYDNDLIVGCGCDIETLQVKMKKNYLKTFIN